METGELIFIGFCSLAAINALFLSVYISFRRDKNVYAAAAISAFLVLTAFRIIQVLLRDLQQDFNLGINLRSIFFLIPTFPLAGPFLYLCIKSVSEKNFRFRAKHLIHLLPFFMVIISDLIVRETFLQQTSDQKFYIAYCIKVSFILVQFLVYIVLSFISAIDLLKKSADESFRRNNDYLLLRNITITISVLWLIYALYCVQIFSRLYLYAIVIESIYYSVLSYLILFIELRSHKLTSLIQPVIRYKTSGLSAADAAKYKAVILEHITMNELYKNHNLTLTMFSGGLSLTPHVVSQVINEQLCCNFNDFVNSYRIEEAKKMLKDLQMANYTVASIAYDCGFNTLSSFNTAFRKFTGITPSQFRNKLQ